MKRGIQALVAAAAIIITSGAMLLASPLSALGGVESIETCIQNWEDANGGDDTMLVCSTTPSAVSVSNLSTHSENLHDGCDGGLFQQSTWNDCISSVTVWSLPANYKALWYAGANFDASVRCVNGPSSGGTWNITNPYNDTISSFRILGGTC